MHTPGAIPEVPFDLANDGDRRVRGERTAFRVVPIHRVDQPEPGNLFKILERFTAPPIATGEPAGKRQREPDQIFPGLLPALRRQTGDPGRVGQGGGI